MMSAGYKRHGCLSGFIQPFSGPTIEQRAQPSSTHAAKMTKMCLAHLGLLLLALHLLSSQVVQAQNLTVAPTNTQSNSSMVPNNTVSQNQTVTDKNGAGRMDAFTLLLPLALAASLLHGCS